MTHSDHPHSNRPELDEKYGALRTDVDTLLEELKTMGFHNYETHTFQYLTLPDHPYLIPDSVLRRIPDVEYVAVEVTRTTNDRGVPSHRMTSLEFHGSDFNVESMERRLPNGGSKINTSLVFKKSTTYNGERFEKFEPTPLAPLTPEEHALLLESLTDDPYPSDILLLPEILKETANWNEYFLRNGYGEGEASLSANYYNGRLGYYSYKCIGLHDPEELIVSHQTDETELPLFEKRPDGAPIFEQVAPDAIDMQDIDHVHKVLQRHVASAQERIAASPDTFAGIDPGFFDAFTRKPTQED